MIVVIAVSAVAGLGLAFLLGERSDRPLRGAVSSAVEQQPDNPAGEMERALRKALEGGGDR